MARSGIDARVATRLAEQDRGAAEGDRLVAPACVGLDPAIRPAEGVVPAAPPSVLGP